MGESGSLYPGGTTASPVPLFAPSSNLTQLFRYDVVRQIMPARTDNWNYGFSEGFFLVPWYSTEVDINIPPYIQHNSSARDGFDDFGAVLKYRLSADNQEHGNYSIAASLPVTFPTGSYQNGATHATLGPTHACRKGIQELSCCDEHWSNLAHRRRR